MHLFSALVFVGTGLNQKSDNFKVPSWAAMKRGVAPSSVVPWSLLAPDSTRNRTTSRCPSPAAMKRGVDPSSVLPWSLLAPDSTRNRTTSRCPSWAAEKRRWSIVCCALVFVGTGLDQKSDNFKVPLLSCYEKRRYSTCICRALVFVGTGLRPEIGQLQGAPPAAAMTRGVAPSSVVPWSLLAPDSTRNRTTSRCPFSSCYEKRRCSIICCALVFVGTGLNQKSDNFKVPLPELPWKEALLHAPVVPWSLLAPASISKDTHWDFHGGMPHTRASLHLHLQNWDFVAGSGAAQEACHHFPHMPPW